ncbi:MAG: guanylate kinase [Desulfovibrio sp.]|nr:guanylate kinase [Desulfovibrio sp.]
MNRAGIPIVVSAPSGAGKSTLCSMLIKEFPNIRYSVSCATRRPRAGEIDGEDYIFLTREEFEKRIANNEFAEYAEVHGNFYGTPLAPALENLSAGRDVLFDIDVKGAASIRKVLPQTRFAFILPPNIRELERRLRNRGLDCENDIKKRLRNAIGEMAECIWYDAIIVNDDLDAAFESFKNFYLCATLAPACRMKFINALLREVN